MRNHAGGLCGYVGLPPEHPVYGKNPLTDDDFPEGIVVHGGLNYGSKCGGEICHVPEPGRPHDVWWLGFDCGHCWDMQPQDIILGIVIGRAPVDDPYRGTYRDVDYVKAQVFLLATQLAVLA